MALNNFGLGFVFRAEDLATGTMRRVRAGYDDLATGTTEGANQINAAMKGIAAGFAVFAVGATALKGAIGLADAAGEFEMALAGVGAVSRASVREMNLLKDAAIQAGIATQFSPTEAVVGLRTLAQAGFSARTSIDLLIPSLDLAAGSLGQLSPEAAAGLASQTLKAFSLEAKDATLVTDKLLKSLNLFALQAGELPLAVGRAVRGASLLHQTLDETLISLGLIKNIIPGVELASTAVSVAMTRLVLPKTQKAFKDLGVSVVDSSKDFRPFLDVIQELIPAMDKLGTQQAKAAWLEEVFGVRALGGVQALMTQITKGIRTNTGELLTGSRAIAHLRKQFDEAGGTAKSFREQLLDTFEGQKILLAGSLQTAAILLGEPFAQVLKPIVMAILNVLNQFIEIMKQTPAPIKRFVAAVILAASVIAMALGALLAFKGAMFLLAPVLVAAKATLAGLAIGFWPITLTIAAVIGLIIAFRVAWAKNLGGIATGITRFVERVKLAFSGIAQLLRDGGFSGALLDEINRAENSGVKKFVITLFKMVHRVKVFVEGIAEGFMVAMDNFSFVLEIVIGMFGFFIDILGGAIKSLWEAMGLTDSASDGFRVMGQILGWIAGFVIVGLIAALAPLAILLTAVGVIVAVIIEIFIFLGKVIGAIAFAFWWTFAVLVPKIVKAAGVVFDVFANRLGRLFTWVGGLVSSVLDSMLGGIASVIAAIPSSLRPVALDVLAGRGGATDARALAAAPLAQSTPAVVPIGTAAPITMSSPGITAAETQASVSRSSSAVQSEAIADGFSSMQGRPIEVSTVLEVDGEVLASVQSSAERSDAARSFSSGAR